MRSIWTTRSMPSSVHRAEVSNITGFSAPVSASKYASSISTARARNICSSSQSVKPSPVQYFAIRPRNGLVDGLAPRLVSWYSRSA
ncbi:MAG: hypothetical protein BWY66_02118 [bacterium ADurb.Bin374]|nr:MAG: hypothetical protein BWY66_02118 [bacterium ADurb.Bin374]